MDPDVFVQSALKTLPPEVKDDADLQHKLLEKIGDLVEKTESPEMEQQMIQVNNRYRGEDGEELHMVTVQQALPCLQQWCGTLTEMGFSCVNDVVTEEEVTRFAVWAAGK